MTDMKAAFEVAFATNPQAKRKLAPKPKRKAQGRPAVQVVKPQGETRCAYDGFTTDSSDEWFAHMRDAHPSFSKN